jgi:NhaP-type Na+/H+ or K+/H+ antiporter
MKHHDAPRSPPQPNDESPDASDPGSADVIATDPRHAPAYMARAVLQFNEQLERIGVVAVVVLVGAILSLHHFDAETAWFVPALLLLIRPFAVMSVLSVTGTSWTQRLLMSWFGIRGIGSIYYLMYALNRGVSEDLAGQLLAITLTVVTVSIFVHGVSATPLMRAYRSVIRGRSA